MVRDGAILIVVTGPIFRRLRCPRKWNHCADAGSGQWDVEVVIPALSLCAQPVPEEMLNHG